LHPPIPFAAEQHTGSDRSRTPAQFYGVFSGLLGRARAIEQAPTFAIQVTPSIGLQPVRKGAEQQMARKVRRRSAAECSMPTAAQLLGVEIMQLRNLDIQRLAIRAAQDRS
jgi:hypothetical protein